MRSATACRAFCLVAATAFFSVASALASAAASHEIVFVDRAIRDHERLITLLPAGAEVKVLDNTADGLAQIADYLSGHDPVAAIHVFSEGRDGAAKLGNRWVDSAVVGQRGDDLRRIGRALRPGGDLLFYGCNVAASRVGRDFISQLARRTGANVAASSNWTGNLRSGGDWKLEVHAGAVSTAPLLDDVSGAAYPHLLNTLQAGDLVVTGWDALTDTVTIVALVSIPSGTVIKITDKGWDQATNAFTTPVTADGVVTWTLSGSVSAGTVLQLVLGGSDNSPATALTNVTTSANLTADISFTGFTTLDPSGIAGDQIFIYQDADANPYFIFGFNNSSGTVDANGWNTSVAITLRDSMLPNGTGSQNSLTAGVNAVGQAGGANQMDNVQYTGPVTGADRATWLARVTDPNKWSGDNTGTITPAIGVSGGSNISLSVAPIFNDGATQTLTVNEDAAATSINSLLDVVDPDSGQTLTWSVTTSPTKGTLSGFNKTASTAGNSTPITPTGLTYTPSANQSGSDSFVIQVSDGTSTDTITVNVTINAVNDTPTLAAISDPATILEDAGAQTVNLSGISAGGGESQTLTVTATSNNTALIPNPTVTYTSANATGSLSYTPVANASGSAVITVTVQDSGGTANGAVDTVTRTFTVNVSSVNDTPTLAAISNPATILEDAGAQTVNLSGISAGGGESQTLTVTATSNNTALIPNPTVTYTSANATGSLSYTPVANVNGSAVITVTVQDNGGTANSAVDTVTRTFTVNVSAVNDTPTLAAISDPAAILEDAGAQTVNLSGISAGTGESQTLTVTATSNNTALIPNPTVTYTSANATGSLSYTPVANANGSAVITVTVQDNGGTANGAVDTVTRTFTVNVAAVNDTPTLAAISDPAAILEDAGAQTINLSGISAGGGESQTLTVTATSNNTALIPNPTVTYTSANATGSLSYTPVANANGSAVITVTVQDNGSTANGAVDTVTRTFTVNVTAVNDTPTLAAISDPAAILEDAGAQTVNLSGISAGGGESQTLTVTATSNNTALIPNPTVTYTSANATGSLSYTPVTNANGSAVITVTVQDNGGTANGAVDTVTRTFTVNVTAVNDPPTVATNAGLTVTEGGSGTITAARLNAADPDDSGVGLTYTVTTLPTNGTVRLSGTPLTALNHTFTQDDIDSSRVTYLHNGGETTSDSFVFSLADGGEDGAAAVTGQTFAITVTPVNDTPTLDAIADPAAILEDAGAQTVNLSGISAGGGESQTLTVTATSNNTALIPNPTVTYTSANATGSLSYTPVANASGSAVITVTVQDNGGTASGAVDTVTRTFTVNVTAVNDTPTLAAIADPATILEDAGAQTVNLSGISAGAGESQTLTVTATSNNTALIPNPTVTYTSANATGSLSYTPVANASGSAVITVTVQDNGGTANGAVDTISRTFTVNVTAVNDTPTLDAIADPATILEDAGAQTVNLAGIGAGGGESQTLTITATSNNTALIPNPTVTYTSANATGSLSYAPVASASGSAVITVTVQDNGGTANGAVDTVTRTFTVNVTAVNDTPTLAAISDPATILEDAGAQTINLSGISAGGGESQTLTVTATSNNTALIPNPTVTYTSANATGSLSYTPVANANGSAVITVTVQDNGGTANGGVDTGTRTFTVNVSAVNDTPTLDVIADPATILEDAGAQTINLSGISAGTGESQTLTVTATSNNTALIPNPTVTYTSANATGSLSYTPVANASGSAVITVTVQDNGGTANGSVDTVTRTFTVNVTAVNDTPTLAAISDPAAILEDAGAQTVNLSGISAGGGESQTLTVTATSNNTALIPNPTVTYTSASATGSLSYTPVANASGSAVITVTVQDNGGTANGAIDTVTRTFTVNVTAVNDTPTLAAISDPAAILEDAGAQTVNLSGISAGTGESQTLTVTATSNNTALIPNPTVTYTSANATGSLSYTPVANANGSAVITVTVQDNGGTANGGVDTVTRTFTVNVSAVNDTPTLASIADPATILEDAGAQIVNLSGISAGGGESQTLTVTATSNNTALIPNPTVTYTSANATGSLSYTPVANANGSAVITVTVQDNGGTANGAVDAVTRTFTVNVTAAADTPSVTNGTTNEDTQTAALPITRNAADGAEVTHFKITAITGGLLFKSDGTTAIASGDFITAAEATAGVKFTPDANANDGSGGPFSFAVQGATSSGGAGLSPAATATVSVAAVNDAPVVTTSGGTTAYVEGNNTTATTVIDGGLTLTDVDNTTLASATVSITGNHQAGEDVLAFTNTGAMGNIAVGTWDSAAGILTLTSASASATLVEWRTALRAVTYANTSDTPNTTARTITFVVNDGATNSAGATKNVSVAATNDSPIVTTTSGTTAFVEGNNVTSTPVAVDNGISVSDVDTAALASATVTITGNLAAAEDVLGLVNNPATMADITGVYTAGTGTLALSSSGTPTKAQWTAALAAVTYTNSSNSPSVLDRTIRFVVNDGNSTSAAGTKTVSVAATNDTPTDIGLSAATINQTAGVNGAVGTLSATDLDDAAFTFTLVAGTGSTDNASFNLLGTALRANDAGALPGGTYSIRVQADDGHTAGTFAKSFTITVVDNVAPLAPSTPDLAAGSDTGSSSADNLTKTTTPVFTGTAEANSTVKLFDGVTQVGSATATSGNWSITSSALAAGAHSLTATATDAATNVSTASAALSITIDTTPPTLSPVTMVSSNANAARAKVGDVVTVSFTASEAISTPTVTIAGHPATVANPSSNNWTATYTLTSGDTAGGVAFNIAFADIAGNAGTAIAATTNASTVTFDQTVPTLTPVALASNNANPALAKVGDVVTLTFTASEAVLTPTVTIATHAVTPTNSSGNNWTATYTMAGSDASGTVPFSIAFADLSGNAGTAVTATTDASSVTFDKTAPAIAIGAPSATLTRTASITYTVTYTDVAFNASTLATGDITLNATGGATATVAVTGTGTTRTVTLSAISGNGTLGITIAAGTASDTAGNLAPASGASTTFTVDNAAPTLSTILRQSPATVNTDAVNVTYRVTFNEAVTGVDAGDFALTVVSGTPSGTIGAVTSVSTSVYDVAVNSLVGQGRVRLDLKATGAGIADLAGNALADGGFTTGDFYIVGVTNVFDATGLAAGTTRSVSNATTAKVAQRFTTAAAAPLSLTTVSAVLGAITGTPAPSVTIHADAAGAIDPTVVATLTNPASLAANALNVWTSTALLSANTTYWVVFADASVAGAYDIEETTATAGGSGAWLTNPDYAYRYGANAGTGPQAGALQIAIGATSVPSITSTLTAGGTYKTAFTYTVTATNLPTSYAATGLPLGLSLNTGNGTITGAPTQTGSFNVSLSATNGSGTGAPSTLVLTVGKAVLTVTANDAQRSYGAPEPAFSVSYTGFLLGDLPSALSATPAATTGTNSASPVGTYAITASGGVSDNYSFNYVNGTLTIVRAAQGVTFAPIADAVIGQSVSLSATASSGLPVVFSVVNGPASVSGSTVVVTGVGPVTVRASQAGNDNYLPDAAESSFIVSAGTPTLTTPTHAAEPSPGGSAALSAVVGNPNVTFQWQRNGVALGGATQPTLSLNNVQPPVAGLYTYTATLPGGGSGVSEPAIVGLATTEKVIGTAEEVGSNIVHPNGNVYDQLLLEGPATTFTANPGQITRLSFIDLTDDIIQVEFSGAGSVSLVMDGASAPAPAVNYNQPGINYVKGHAGIVIVGANETSNLSIISVGRINAVNQALFRDDVTYDGIADIAFVAIQSTNGKFGGLRTGNANYFATQGFTGVYAPGVQFMGPVYVGDINAFDVASPVLVLGAVDDARITGGSLLQPNNAAVKVGGLTHLRFVNGTTSHGLILPAQANRGRLVEDGVDVTDLIVVNP